LLFFNTAFLRGGGEGIEKKEMSIIIDPKTPFSFHDMVSKLNDIPAGTSTLGSYLLYVADMKDSVTRMLHEGIDPEESKDSLRITLLDILKKAKTEAGSEKRTLEGDLRDLQQTIDKSKKDNAAKSQEIQDKMRDKKLHDEKKNVLAKKDEAVAIARTEVTAAKTKLIKKQAELKLQVAILNHQISQISSEIVAQDDVLQKAAKPFQESLVELDAKIGAESDLIQSQLDEIFASAVKQDWSKVKALNDKHTKAVLKEKDLGSAVKILKNNCIFDTSMRIIQDSECLTGKLLHTIPNSAITLHNEAVAARVKVVTEEALSLVEEIKKEADKLSLSDRRNAGAYRYIYTSAKNIVNTLVRDLEDSKEKEPVLYAPLVNTIPSRMSSAQRAMDCEYSSGQRADCDFPLRM